MKTLRNILLFLLLAGFASKAQNCNDCNYMNDFYPDPIKDSVIIVKVNVYYASPTSGVGRYDNATYIGAKLLVEEPTNSISFYLNNLFQAQLAMSPAPAYISDSKLKFVLNDFQIINDDALYYAPDVPSNQTRNYAPNVVPSIPSAQQGLNIVFNVDTNSFIQWDQILQAWVPDPPGTYGLGSPLGGGLCNIRGDHNNPNPYSWWPDVSLVAHEIGHTLGLIHSNESPSGFPQGCLTDYVLENIVQFKGIGNSCDLDPNHSNNLMGYNWCRKYLSPRQLAVIHMYLRTSLSHAVTITPNNPILGVNHAFDYDVTSNETWTHNRYFKGDITVKQGYQLTIECQVGMAEGAKILVEPGAKLIIDGGHVTNLAGRLWSGIEVAGQISQPQSYTYQGLLNITNQGKISNAENAAKNYCTDANHNINWTSMGGIIIGSEGVFENNIRDVEFLEYPINSASIFDLCTFVTSAKLGKTVNDANPKPFCHVSMWKTSAVKFRGCNFLYTGGGYNYDDRGIGILSGDANYLVNKYNSTYSEFNGMEYGIYTSNTNPAKTATIKFSRFIHNYMDGIHLQNMYNFVLEDNIFHTPGGSGGPFGNCGLYLNQCKYYNVRNNTFLQDISAQSDIGIQVHDSRDGAHEIYRNNFANLGMAINLHGNNSGVNNITTGLKMNCNDFTVGSLNFFDIAMENTPAFPATVRKWQADYDNVDPLKLVRNIYGANSDCSVCENKWYIEYPSARTIYHYSNQESYTQPTPQPENSDVDLIVIGTSKQLNYTDHCPTAQMSSGGNANPNQMGSLNSYLSTLIDMNSLGQYKNEIQATMASKLNLFLTDSVWANADSVVSIYTDNISDMDDADILQIFALMSKRDYTQAKSKVNGLPPQRKDWATLLATLIELDETPSKAYEFESDGDIRELLETYASKDEVDGQSAAKGFLEARRGVFYEVPRKVPENFGARMIYQQGEVQAGKEVAVTNYMSVFPNPARELLYVSDTRAKGSDLDFVMTDALGRQVRAGVIPPSSVVKIPVNDLKEGIYILSMYEGKKPVCQTKVVCIK